MALIFFTLAFLCFFWAFKDTIKVYYYGAQQEDMIKAVKVENIKRQIDHSQNVDAELIKDDRYSDIYLTEMDEQEGKPIGQISIPSVNIHIPVVLGAHDNNLYKGAATNKKGQVMGEGNYALSSHYMYDGKSLFTPLDNIELGAKIYVTDFQKVYVYEYNKDMELVKPYQIEVIADRGIKEITLYTCTPDAEYRRIYNGDYLGYYLYEELSEKQLEEFLGVE